MEKTSHDGSETFAGRGDEPNLLFELLSHPYRRFVISSLSDTEALQTRHEVATDLGTSQAESSPANGAPGGVDAIESRLHHTHLPKLAAANVIEYDPSRGTVAFGDRASAVIPYLDESWGGK